MAIVDLTGVGIRELLADAGVAAIVGQKVRPEWGAGEEPPGVIIEQLGIDYSPLGRTRSAKLQAPTFAAKCFGANRRQAQQLGNAVAAAMELRKARKDANGRLIVLSVVESNGNIDLDPVTKWPFATVVYTLIGAQAAVS